MNLLQQQELDQIVWNKPQENEGFKIDSLQGVNWCMRKLRALNEKQKEIESVKDEELRRIEIWANDEVKSIQSDKEFFEAKILEYFKQQRELDPKVKLSTPYGKVAIRKSKKWKYINEEELIGYMEENEYTEGIRVKKELNKTFIKQMFKDGINEFTGEILPGVEIVEMEDISVKID